MKEKISRSVKLEFLIGFFYFSGFYEIHEEIKDKEMQILIGLDSNITKGVISEIMSDTSSKLLEEKSVDEIRKEYINTLKKLLNNSQQLDNEKTLKSWQIFKDKLLNGTLSIKKTKNPHHAKMYIFIFDRKNIVDRTDPGNVIIGSSNFTYKGLSSQDEINVLLKESFDFEAANQIFEELWDDAIPLVDKNNAEIFIDGVEPPTWLNPELPTPYQMYIRVLIEYFKLNSEILTPHDITGNDNYRDLDYQTDAIRKGVDIIKKHSGVIVADVVGLGKSVIASCIAYNLKQKVIVITPPHLKNQWEEYANEFKLDNAKVYSSGNLQKVVEHIKKYKGKYTIIVDEVHKFRNEDTKNYSLLERICINNDVILLSATPFNNQPKDILSLLKLFQIPSHPTIETTNNLARAIGDLQSKYDKIRLALKTENGSATIENEEKLKEIADEMKRIIAPVVIRRTRKDLDAIDRYKEDLENNNIHFPKINVESKEYDLNGIEELYKKTLERLIPPGLVLDDSEKPFDLTLDEKHFVGSRYIPLLYLKKDKIKHYQDQIYDGSDFRGPQISIGNILRLQFIRRFESSIGAFLKSLENNIKYYNTVIDWCDKKGIFPIFNKNKFIDISEYDVLTSDENQDPNFDDDENSVLSKTAKVRIKIEDFDENFLKQLKADKDLLIKMKDEWLKINGVDPKFDTILDFIKNDLRDNKERKIIVFTEFADTAVYLKTMFEKNNFKTIIKYSAKDKTTSVQKAIKNNFDAGVGQKEQKNDYTVLIATDAISEGWSLHRAGVIYNYDVPYNPMRVVQRVGRINRVNKQLFSNIYVYNYFPSIIGEQFYKNKDIANLKMKLSNAIFGGTDVIDSGDEAAFWTDEIQRQINNEEQSWDVRYRNILAHVSNNDKENFNKANKISQRVKIKRNKEFKSDKRDSDPLFKDENPLLIFSLKDGEIVFTLKDSVKQRNIRLTPEVALKNFEATVEEKCEPFNSEDWKKYEIEYLKDEYEIPPKIGSSINNAKKNLEAYKTQLGQDNARDREYINELIQLIKSQDIGDNIIKEIAKLKKFTDMETKLESIISQNEVRRLREKKNAISEKDDIIQLVEIFEKQH